MAFHIIIFFKFLLLMSCLKNVAFSMLKYAQLDTRFFKDLYLLEGHNHTLC